MDIYRYTFHLNKSLQGFVQRKLDKFEIKLIIFCHHIIDAFNTTSRYLDDILNINSIYFDNMVSKIYPAELQLN